MSVCMHVCACVSVCATCMCMYVHRVVNQLIVGYDEAQKRLNSVFRPTYRKRERRKKGQKRREGKLNRKRETEKSNFLHTILEATTLQRWRRDG